MQLEMPEGFEHLSSDEDVEEILRLAVRRTSPEGATLRDRLEMSADELGISRQALAEAEQQWAAKKRGELDLATEDADRRLFRKMRFGDFVSHVGSYLAVNGFLVWLDMRGDGHLDWAYWVILPWGIGMVCHLFALFGHGQDAEREFQRWRRKRYRKRD